MSTAPNFSSVYVYLRFSSDAQAVGYSLERQREAATKRLSRIELNQTPVVWLEDPGLSAYKGVHMKTGELGRFLSKVRSGKIRDGLFVCESVSRASRQGAFVVLTMLNDLFDAGFSVLFLDQPDFYKRSTIPPFLAVQLTLLADLAQEESRIKSDYAKKNWDRKRVAARENSGAAFTSECPNWLEVQDGKYVVIPDRVASIKEIYARARDGWGISRLVRYANTNKLPAPGKNGTWHLSLIKRILTNKALIGEFQPHVDEGLKRVPFKDPIQNFYPVVLDRDLFYAVQGLRSKAAKFPKRRDGNNFNYLQGIAKCECGGSWRRMNKNSGAQQGYALYGCSNRVRAATDCANVNARTFDFQFIAFALNRIPDMLASGENPLEERRQSIEAQLVQVAKKKENLIKFVEDNSDMQHELAARLRDLLNTYRSLSDELDDVIGQEAPPPGFSFDEAVEVFLPAYLDVFAEETPQWEDAYRARSLFRTRIIEAVTAVWVAKDRSSLQLTLKNGAKAIMEIELDMQFGAINDELDADELEELNASRKANISSVRKMNNAKNLAGK